MKALEAVFSVLLLGSTLAPTTTNADAARAQSRAAQPLARVERALLAQGTASYLHGGIAAALGMDTAKGAISVFQREADIPHGGKVIAVTLVETRGQRQIILASWTETEVRAYLTSPSGILKKAVRATNDQEGWKEIPVRQARQAYAVEKQYWLDASASGPSSEGTRAGR